jgi:hypothetical protein
MNYYILVTSKINSNKNNSYKEFSEKANMAIKEGYVPASNLNVDEEFDSQGRKGYLFFNPFIGQKLSFQTKIK